MGKTDVIVIGAGISGIKAAQDLAKNGISTLILEGRDRIGGRLHVEKFSDGTPVDIGASWFHDCYYNPLLDKYWKNGKVKFNYDDGRIKYTNEEGIVDDNERLKPVFEEIKLFMADLYDKLKPNEDISIKEAIYLYLKERKHRLTDYQIKHVPQLVRYFEMWIGSSWEILSARSIATDNHKGRDAMVLNGYTTVLNSELDELINVSGNKDLNEILTKDNYLKAGGSSIKLNNIVYKIKWDDKKKLIDVYTKSENSNHINIYTAPYLIVTVPLSILKLKDLNEKGAIEWEPKLPTKFVKSLDGVSFSTLGKVFFKFPKTFWDMKDDRILSMANVDKGYYNATKNDPANISTFKFDFKKEDKPLQINGKIPNGLDYTLMFFNLAKPLNKPYILALTSSPLTQYLEAQTDPKVIFEVFKPVFARISGLKESEIPIPLEIKHTEWSIDPFARGSYTGVTMGDDFEPALEQLLDPKEIFDGKGRVRFAGEGAIDEGNGCVHAAWISAEREAKKVITLINKSKL